jgi:competence protein ComEA
MIGDLKTEPEWIETVENMESIGAKGTEEEFDRVRRYLARNFTRINVNAATAAQIAPVLDITETAAQAVVEYRTKHGDFMNLEDLRKVPELDAAKIEARKQRVVFR